jgi:ABC-type Fe3+-hydroxamate transport system substrate-binding protein
MLITMRAISLVPSLTDTFFAITRRAGSKGDGSTLCGRTAYCIHPKDEIADVPIVGGTKTPKLDRILRNNPDLVLLDKEENPRSTYEELEAAGVPTFVSHVTGVTQVPGLLRALAHRLGLQSSGEELAKEVESALAHTQAQGPATPKSIALIWHDPLMALSSTRYGGSLLRHVGFELPEFESATGYPVVDPQVIARAGVELLLLSSEPHDFTEAEGQSLADAVVSYGGHRPAVRKIDGERLTWFGSRTAEALGYFSDLRRSLLLG